MPAPILYILSQNIIPDLLHFCHENSLASFYLVADPNTYQVLGNDVEQALRKDGMEVKTIIITGSHIHTDEHFLIQAMVELAGDERVFIAVGSGTVTDITRFISHRSRNPFISIPTAPSVDGYTSTVAPMVVGNYKFPAPAQPPIAVFGNLPTLC
jgi:glycerol-1-phosphate dehydrogenase [NAD(P)+]